MKVKTFTVIMAACVASIVILFTIFVHTTFSGKHVNSYLGTFLHGPSPTKYDSNAQLDFQTLTNGHTMEMVIRMTSRPTLIKELYCSMFRSAALFWSPRLSNITMVMDEESKADHELAARLKKQEKSLGFDLKFLFEPLPKDRSALRIKQTRSGYLRMLWSSFFIDSHTDATIIAWMDSDAMLTTPVIPENIFNGNKLRVIGGAMFHEVHASWATSVKIAIGRKMPANFMSYFPVYIWRDTFARCREYILKHLNVSRFEDAFMIIHKPPRYRVSPVCILLTYAYFFEHDRYDWHLDVNYSKSLADFNKKFAEPGFEVKPGDISPDVHVTLHAKHYDNLLKNNPLKQGYCVAKRYADKLPKGCEMYKDTINMQLFEFDFVLKWKWHTDHLGTWCKAKEGQKRCAKIIHEHYEKVAKYYKKGLYDLNLQRLRNVETAANNVNVTCALKFNLT